MKLYFGDWAASIALTTKLILLLLVLTDTWQTTKYYEFKGCARDSKMEVIVTRWYVSWSNIWCCCSLSKVVVLSRIATTNCSTVLLLVPTADLSLFIRPRVCGIASKFVD